MKEPYLSPPELVLGRRLNKRVPAADQQRQRAEVDEILSRFAGQPGVILADEVGMGKTFVALAIAYSVAMESPKGPVIVMVPSNLIDKWKQDLGTFCDLYLDGRKPVDKNGSPEQWSAAASIRYGVALNGVELMKLLDDPPRDRCHLIFLAQRAMGRRQTDKWIRLALIGEALRRHGRGKATRLIQVKRQIHRFLARLISAIGEERAQELGVELWQHLLSTEPSVWKGIFNKAVRDEHRQLKDDPVPKAVVRALRRVELKTLADALQGMPIRAVGGDQRVAERIEITRRALRDIEHDLWKEILATARWRSPLLVMDEAHHLKNPSTALARQFKGIDEEQSLRTGDAAMANAFDRMLFLTATPFQLGHHELLQVLGRFRDVRWNEDELGARDQFDQQMSELGRLLDDSQRSAIALQRNWSKLTAEDLNGFENVDEWWLSIVAAPRDRLTHRQRAVVESFDDARRCRNEAQRVLRRWLVRHNKGAVWTGSSIPRRQRVDGGAIRGLEGSRGLPIPPAQLLPFFLAARSVVKAEQDLLGEALCSSYEAFRFTRERREAEKDILDEDRSVLAPVGDLSHARWYLREFDRSLADTTGATHPKVSATVQKVVDLWEAGEKVLVFAFYRRTCRALRIHISKEIERRILATARERLSQAGSDLGAGAIERLLDSVQKRYIDDVKAAGRRALDRALRAIVNKHAAALDNVGVSGDQREEIVDIMRRFLRVTTTLVRCFPLAELPHLKPTEVVDRALNQLDSSGASWRQKFDTFIQFLLQCSVDERNLYLEAASGTKTGGIRVKDEEDDDPDLPTVTLANVQVATGTTKRDTRARLMRAFNTPFFPDILVCSEVMGEGVDLQRFCRHVIHHDLAWNPSTIEQRTGRIDRLACKAEGQQPIVVYLPYVAGEADERQYKVMSDREQWFRVVMGQEEVARLITPETATAIRLPDIVSNDLSFKLAIE